MAKQYGYKPAYGHFCSQLKSFYDNKNMKPMDAFTDNIYHDFMRKAGVLNDPFSSELFCPMK